MQIETKKLKNKVFKTHGLKEYLTLNNNWSQYKKKYVALLVIWYY
jgi:hypothetical protein